MTDIKHCADQGLITIFTPTCRLCVNPVPSGSNATANQNLNLASAGPSSPSSTKSILFTARKANHKKVLTFTCHVTTGTMVIIPNFALLYNLWAHQRLLFAGGL